MRRLQTTVALALGALMITSGCSVLIGPNKPGPKKETITKQAAEDWIDFTTIDEANVTLRGAENWFRKEALEKSRIADGGSDVVTTTLIAGAVAGATGSPTGARIGAGLAALFGYGIDRYKLEAQHDIFVRGADAFACLGRAIDGLDSATLNLPLTTAKDTEKLAEAELNERRVTVVSEVRNATRDVRKSFEAAMAKIKLVQPDINALESALKEKSTKVDSTPKTALLSIANQSAYALRAPVGLRAAGVAPAKSIDALRSELDEARAEAKLEQLRAERLSRTSTTPSKDIEIANGKRDAADLKLKAAEAALRSALEVNRDQSESDRMMLMVVRLRTINEQLNICKALVSGNT